MNYNKFQKYVGTGQVRQRFKKQCLKSKNILFENEQVQIGCKVTALYDFYSSQNYLQINIFIGNKSDRTIDSFQTDYKGTPNLALFIQEKDKLIRQKTQFKERLILSCDNYQEEILLLLDFQSNLLTLKSTPIPITLFSFCFFNSNDIMPLKFNQTADVFKMLQQKYQYTQDCEIGVSPLLFKKGVSADLAKYFMNLSQVCQGTYFGVFTMKSLIDEFALTIEVVEDKKLKMSLSSNNYAEFQNIFGNLKYLLA